VKKIEATLCPFCRAYERVYGRKAHEATANRKTCNFSRPCGPVKTEDIKT
jgi:hypothetical protein